jgi:HTH-type transcriptional regulator/antitoxin HigA
MEKVLALWPQIGSAVRVPHTEREYRQLVKLLNRLIDEVGESHPLASLMEVLGVLIEKYEDEHVKELA